MGISLMFLDSYCLFSLADGEFALYSASMASHPRKFIAQPTDDDLKKFPDEVKHLIKKGREQRYVTHQEIMAAVPIAEDNVELLDEIYTLFVDIGIQVIDVKDSLIWKKEKKEGGTQDLPDATQDLTEIVSGDGDDDDLLE